MPLDQATATPPPQATAPASTATEFPAPAASATPVPQSTSLPWPTDTPIPWVPDDRPESQQVNLPYITAHYAIHLTTVDLDARTVEASQTVTVQEFRAGVPEQLYFQMLPAGYGFNSVQAVTLDGQPIDIHFINDGFTLVVPLSREAVAPVEIGIDFRLQLALDSEGWGYTGFDTDVMRLGFWNPLISNAHGFSQTFDPFYGRVATFDVTLDIEPSAVVAHSGEQVSSETLADGRVRYQYHAENVRDFDFAISRTYIMASAVSSSGVLIEYYWRDGLAPNVSDAVLAAAVDAVDQLTDLIGPYPWPTLRIADAGPNMPGGIEFANLIYINPAYDPLERLIYHEVGHMWLYGIIGNRTLDDGWIDEGGAEFLERGLPTGFSEVPPIPDGGYQFPLDSTVDEIPYVWPDWYYAIYEQGARLYYDVLAWMGWDAFWSAMQDVYAQYQFDIVTAYDLLRLWQRHSPVDLRPLFNDYFRYDWIDALPEPGVTAVQGWIPVAPTVTMTP
jgi:hypothetical protein